MAVILPANSDPLSVASEAVGSFYDAKRKKETEDAAAAYTAARDKRADMESDRTYGLAQNRDTREGAVESRAAGEEPGKLQLQGLDIKKAQSGLATDALTQQKTKLDIDYQQKHQPLQLEYERLQNKAEAGQILTAADTHRLNQLNLQLKQIDLEYAAQGKQLEMALKRAQIAEANARAAKLAHPEPPKPSESERAMGAYNTAMNGLSPLGRQFLDMLYSSNNQPTRGQALQALQQARLPDADKQNVQTIIESKESQFVSPTEQVGQAATAANRATTATREAGTAQHTDRNQEFTNIARGQVYDALPGRLKDAIRHVMVDQGKSVDDALASLDTAPPELFSDTDKQRIRQVLGQKPQ